MICIDANQGYSVAQALDLGERIADQDIMWFEEPVGWDNDARGMRDVRMRGPIPVCAGQSEVSPVGCRNLMEVGAIDFCNFDASWSGGPTVSRSGTTRSPRCRRTSSRARRTAPWRNASTPTATPSGGI